MRDLRENVLSIDSADRAAILARRDTLVEQNLHLVIPIAESAKRSLPPSFDIDDLIGAGNHGLLMAATTFRPWDFPGVPFEAHARTIIHRHIWNSTRDTRYRDATMEPMPQREGSTGLRAIDSEVDLATAVAKLPERHQEVIRLYYVEGLTLAEVGERLRIGRHHAGFLRRLALQALRQLLAA